MAYDIIDDDGTAEIRLAGDLTFAEHGKFRTVVANLARRTPERVVFDLSRVDYIDAAGLGLLLVARDTVDGRAALKGARGQVGRMLALARFDDLFRAA